MDLLSVDLIEIYFME